MKSIFILSTAATAGLVAAAPLDPPPKLEVNKFTVPGVKIVPKPLWDRLFDDKGKLQSVFSTPAGVVAPQSKVAEIQKEKSKVFEGTTRLKIRHGPYRLPPISEDNWQKKTMNLAGMADE